MCINLLVVSDTILSWICYFVDYCIKIKTENYLIIYLFAVTFNTYIFILLNLRGRRGCDHMVLRFLPRYS